MEKETVLEIEFIPVWDKWAWRITKNELFNLYAGVDECENELLQLKLKKGYESCIFMYNDVIDDYEETPNCILLEESEKERLEKLVRSVNEKYGKPKRWRAEDRAIYFYINTFGEILVDVEAHDTKGEELYKCGNYFQTRKQAEKARELQKKAYQEVWEHE